jgi:hypothetical protein
MELLEEELVAFLAGVDGGGVEEEAFGAGEGTVFADEMGGESEVADGTVGAAVAELASDEFLAAGEAEEVFGELGAFRLREELDEVATAGGGEGGLLEEVKEGAVGVEEAVLSIEEEVAGGGVFEGLAHAGFVSRAGRFSRRWSFGVMSMAMARQADCCPKTTGTMVVAQTTGRRSWRQEGELGGGRFGAGFGLGEEGGWWRRGNRSGRTVARGWCRRGRRVWRSRRGVPRRGWRRPKRPLATEKMAAGGDLDEGCDSGLRWLRGRRASGGAR